MKITSEADTLRVSELRELNNLRADDLAQDIRAALTPDHATIEFDLAQLRSISCDTVDRLVAVHGELNPTGTRLAWRVRNPSPDLRQLFELVRLHHLFEITPPRAPSMVLL